MEQARNLSLTFYGPGQASRSPRRPSGEPGLLKVTTGSAPGLMGCPGQSVARKRPAYCRPTLLSPCYLWVRTMLEIK